MLEGLHALKHALRFGARVRQALSPDRRRLLELAESLCPDLVPRLQELVEEVPVSRFATLAGGAVPTGVISFADPPAHRLNEVLACSGSPIVLLDRPTHHGNVGATIRTAAAADAAAVLTTGPHDPWHRSCLRGSAGLHFALPILHIDDLPDTSGRPLVALDPDGAPLRPGSVPDDAILLFGSERRGLDGRWRRRAERTFCLPMRAGVSSLNLASSVAAVLYRWRIDRM
ncbi:TrmH family RNA methyltransferase [Geminicoccus sp.]|uniref:TrmH family RNA methyltransferase n=1 Tax=Geminicoccus sp. TaxID=2024832 RepID=UPI002E37868C|nr:TrmH family RNA methyltransferase [Geminicoccus sp.]